MLIYNINISWFSCLQICYVVCYSMHCFQIQWIKIILQHTAKIRTNGCNIISFLIIFKLKHCQYHSIDFHLFQDQSSNGDASSPRKSASKMPKRISSATPSKNRSLSRDSKSPSLKSPDSNATTPGTTERKS